MKPSGLPPTVRRFISEYIDSIEQLEVLLLLYAEPETAWTVEQVAGRLHGHPVSIARRLGSLHEHRMLVRTAGPGPTYRFAPTSEGGWAAVAELAAAYKERPVAVITLIASRPMENVRAFSDAFRVRRKGED